MKRCSRCKTAKPVEDFGTDRSRSDGLNARCLSCAREANASWRDANREKSRAQTRKSARRYRHRVFGLSDEQYAEMLEAQDGRCAVCGCEPKTDTGLAVDHNHETGEVRGLLCIPCNVGIGNLRDNAKLLRAAADYLDFYALVEA